MAELRDLLNNSGFIDVQTYIQSGNLVIWDEETNTGIIEKRIKKAITSHYGFEVEVLVNTREEIIRIAGQNPFETEAEVQQAKLYYVFLNSTPSPDLTEKLESQKFVNERFRITNSCIYLCCDQGYGKAKCNNNFFESKLKLVATTRNHKTVHKLIEMSAEED